jgi:hypothetical protein
VLNEVRHHRLNKIPRADREMDGMNDSGHKRPRPRCGGSSLQAVWPILGSQESGVGCPSFVFLLLEPGLHRGG